LVLAFDNSHFCEPVPIPKMLAAGMLRMVLECWRHDGVAAASVKI
jgi:hypothetical protein